jgi:hypothetical protein
MEIKMALYKLPLGIRVPNDNEYPKGYDVKSINEKRNSANIVEGFIIKEESGERFSHYAEVNINVDRIWDVFCGLAYTLIQTEAYGILSFKEEKPRLSSFTEVDKIIEIFNEYRFELTNDGYIEFGIANYDKSSLNEIFVSSFKYMKIWTTKQELLIETLNSYGIHQIDNLQFIDEYPVVSEALSDKIVKGVRHYSEVIECIGEEFEKLETY